MVREKNGRFGKGNPGGPGRPPLAVEMSYVEATKRAITPEVWQQGMETLAERISKGDVVAIQVGAKLLGLDVTRVENSGTVTITVTYRKEKHA